MLSHKLLPAKNAVLALTAFILVLTLAPTYAAEPPVIEINRTEAADSEERESVAPLVIYSPEQAASTPEQQRLSPMMQEIQAAIEQGRAQNEELESRAAVAGDEESILAIQRQIEELAQATELEILGIQARHARLAGRDEIADKIEQDIADIQNPPVVRVRLERPELDSQ